MATTQTTAAIPPHSLKEAPMFVLSATCAAIAIAAKAGTLRLEERASRFGDTFIAISDGHGLIEVQDNWQAAKARIAEVAR